MKPHRRFVSGVVLGPLLLALPLAAQEEADERTAALAVAEAALAAITAEDMAAFTDLMVEEGVTFAVLDGEEGPRHSFRRREEWRAQSPDVDIVERGFDAQVHVSGPLAVVWLPYDLYLDGAWSHCGVDTFTLVRTAEGWRIASLAWTVEQPPACRRHPEGPPAG